MDNASEPESAIIPSVADGPGSTTRFIAGKPAVRRGRPRASSRPSTSRNLFAEDETAEMAANDLIQQTCDLLAQTQNLNWSEAALEPPRYGPHETSAISYWLTSDLHKRTPAILEQEAALALIEQFDIRAACLHLIYAAYAAQLERPWEEQFVISDRELEVYLGLDKNKKLNRPEKLALMLALAKQPCHLLVYVSYPEGSTTTSTARTWLWEIAEPILHFQTNLLGEAILDGFTLRLRAGNWARHFLRPSPIQAEIGGYDYGVLSQEILHNLMSGWHKYEGSARLMLWLLFKTKEGSTTLPTKTLLQVAFGVRRVEEAQAISAQRKRLVSQWKTIVKVLDGQGWQFCPIPASIPINPAQEAGLGDFITAEETEQSGASQSAPIGPYGGFEQLLNSQIQISPPLALLRRLGEIRQKRGLDLQSLDSVALNSTPTQDQANHQINLPLSLAAVDSNVIDGKALKALRIQKSWTQEELARQIGKSKSWIKMVESGRRRILPEDQQQIRAKL